MDGSALIWPSSRGGGSVSCSPDCNNLEQQFFITPIAEDTNIYTIQSVPYPGVYLRMDGTGLDEFALHGGGVVNCQRGVASYEKFRIVYNAGQYAGMFSIESKAFPFVYLRTDGDNNIVNCQYGAVFNEMYKIRSV